MSAILPNIYGYNFKRHFHFDLTFPELTPQTAILDLSNDSVSKVHLINQILLLFKFYIYKSQNKCRLNINDLLANTLKIKKLEKITAFDNVKQVAAYKKMGYSKQKNFAIE